MAFVALVIEIVLQRYQLLYHFVYGLEKINSLSHAFVCKWQVE